VRLKAAILLLGFSLSSRAQSSFQNLNFESANVSGYSTDTEIPITAALPGWYGYYGNTQTSQAGYDIISIGAAVISVIDDKAPVFAPLQSNYSAFLFGGAGVSATISQMGTTPTGSQSLVLDAWYYDASPIVSVNGQALTLIPIQAFSNYTMYEADISSYSGLVTLSFTEPSPATGGPSEFEFDNISFSPNAVTPEPSPLVLAGIGGLLFTARKWFAWSRDNELNSPTS
jgi:hypothetical protein